MSSNTAPVPPIGPLPERLRDRLQGSGLAYVTLKAAATLDGRIATRTGVSQWITGEAARAHAMRLRAGHDAVLVGRGTAQADDPRLTVRAEGLHARPARVVLDSLARIDPGARLLAADGARRVVVTGCEAPAARTATLEALGTEVLRCSTPRPEPREYLAGLRAAGLETLLVEGGSEVHADLIAQGAANELFLYLAGCVLGDREAPAWCGPLGIERLDQAPRVHLEAPQVVGPDVLLHGWFEPAPAPVLGTG